MNGFRNWFHNLGMRMSAGLARFMQGRYGTDKLNNVILGLGVAACIINMFIRSSLVNVILMLVSYALMFWAIFRSLSRNTYKRYQENRKYLRFMDQIKDRDHRYFTCPRCRQSVRVPRGAGKIAIRCPKCGERFVKKT